MSPTPPSIATITAGDRRPPAAIESLLDEQSQSRVLRRTLIGVVFGILVLMGWATFTHVDELARARGEVQPSGHVQVLQSQEGGRITKLMVKEGDTVTAGQVIASFSSSDIQKLRAQTDIRLASLDIDRERMQAILQDRRPNWTAYRGEYPLLVEQAESTHRAQVAARDAAIAAKRAEGDQQAALIGGATDSSRLIETQIAEAQARLSRLEEGARQGVVSRMMLSDARQQLTALQERLAETVSRAAGMRSTASGVNAEVARVRAEVTRQLSQELAETVEKYRELVAERKALDERQGQVDIKAPISGVVMNLPQTGEGAVIPPGGVVAELVPAGMDVIMEVMVSPRDIGFVKTGQRASVKIDSFDSARFGAVEGRVARIAPTSTKLRENGMPFYKVEVALSSPYVGDRSHPLVPGMTGEADIATGHKSVMQYLLKPLFLAADTAFHER